MTRDHIDIRIKGQTVFVEDPSGAWKTKGHKLSLPWKKTSFRKQLRLLRFEPEGHTAEERERKGREMELQVAEGGGFTVIGGFGALLIATDFPILQGFGIVTMLDVFLALVTTLVVLPTLIVWQDSWREKHGKSKTPAAST